MDRSIIEVSSVQACLNFMKGGKVCSVRAALMWEQARVAFSTDLPFLHSSESEEEELEGPKGTQQPPSVNKIVEKVFDF